MNFIKLKIITICVSSFLTLAVGIQAATEADKILGSPRSDASILTFEDGAGGVLGGLMG